MADQAQIRAAMRAIIGKEAGAFVLVDGQYGSTGKGLAAAVLAEAAGYMFDGVASNAGPNSGHTSYHNGEKIVLQQLPTFGVICEKIGMGIPMYMNAGAIIDIDRLLEEIQEYLPEDAEVRVHPHAAVITSEAKEMEADLVGRIGSTGKGTGAAIARKVLRMTGAVMQDHPRIDLSMGVMPKSPTGVYFVEVSQGYSLSMNAGGFYPYCTSRDCTVAQAMADAGFHPQELLGSMMVMRTFPIRVAGKSGGHYPDQKEITWEQLGQEPEITTVTKKERRVFTWSNMQYIDALKANRPDMLFFNFMNYLPPGDREKFLASNIERYVHVMGKTPKLVLAGYGPNNNDVEVVYV